MLRLSLFALSIALCLVGCLPAFSTTAQLIQQYFSLQCTTIPDEGSELSPDSPFGCENLELAVNYAT
jgi:hypothetical protein